VDDVDADNSMGLQSLISWAEDAWVAVLAVLACSGADPDLLPGRRIAPWLWLLQKHLDRRAEKSKVECAACRAKVFPFATVLLQLPIPAEKRVSIGFLGRTDGLSKGLNRPSLEVDVSKEVSKLRLPPEEEDRPPDCVQTVATHLASSDNLPDRLPGKWYGPAFRNRVYCGLLSAGSNRGHDPGHRLLPGLLVSPFRAYTGLGSSFLSRWVSRIVGILLVALFSWIPILSTFVAPALAYMNYAVYRHAFLAQWNARQRSEIAHGKGGFDQHHESPGRGDARLRRR